MAIYDAIKNFNTQFAFEPKIENAERLGMAGAFIVAGMGGSHLAADILKVWNPALDLVVHKNYGLPNFPEDNLNRRLLIASSYSGNTEETIDAYEKAGERGLARAVISVGGKLIERAEKDEIPYIRLPDTGIQPRMALGLTMKAIFRFMGEEKAAGDLAELSKTLEPQLYEKEGKALALRIKGFVPVVYSSERNWPIAYNWKIKLNETGKIPAFYNIFPELNHNEMTGFDPVRALTAVSERPISNGAGVFDSRKKLNSIFRFIFLKDPEDHPRIQKRMETTEKLYQDRGLSVERFDLQGDRVFHKIFSSLILADWAAYFTAVEYGVEPEQVPMVEEFKVLLQNFKP